MFDNLQLLSRSTSPVSGDWGITDVHSHYTIYEDGTYLMYYNLPLHLKKGGLCLATSSDGEHFENKGVLFSDNERKIWKCRVLRFRREDWRMWYGRVFEAEKAVGYAVSSDGLLWKTFGSIRGDWGKIFEFTPILCKDGVFHALYYTRNSGCFLCESFDGVFWRSLKKPVITPLSWEQKTVSPKCLKFINGEFVLAYEAGGTGRYGIGLAYSSDLINWERDERNPILKPRLGFFDECFVSDPSLIFMTDSLRIYYGAKDHRGVGTVGLAIFQL